MFRKVILFVSLFILMDLLNASPRLFDNRDRPFFAQGSGLYRITTINNNNINYTDNSLHYNYNIQKTSNVLPDNGKGSAETSEDYSKIEPMT